MSGKTTLYLIRHGESAANEIDVFLGHTDLDLTKRGSMQAEKTAEYFRNIDVDVIYSSDLVRAYHTAECTARLKGLEIITDMSLREIEAGEWDMKTFSELETKFCDDYSLWMNDIGNARCTGGESVMELMGRVSLAVTKIAEKNEGKTVLIFTHATPIRALKTIWDGLSVEDMQQIPWASNASVTKAEYENGEFAVAFYSSDSHMGDIATALPDNV